MDWTNSLFRRPAEGLHTHLQTALCMGILHRTMYPVLEKESATPLQDHLPGKEAH